MKIAIPFALVVAARLGAQVPANGITSPGSASGPPIGIVSPTRAGTPGFISGRVAMEDGSPISGAIAIQRICSTSAQTVAHVDGMGRFSFQTGSTGAADTSASETGTRTSSGMLGIGPMSPGLGTAPIQHCELRASLAGYRSDVLDLTNRRSTDSPDVGLIVLHKNTGGAQTDTVNAQSLAIPGPALKAYRSGLTAMRANDVLTAKKEFEKAAALWRSYAEPRIQLGIMAGRRQSWEECARFLDEGLKLNPTGYAQAWYVDAMANYYLKNYEAAEKSAREALRLDPEHRNPRAGYVLGMTLAQKRDYVRAAEELRAFLKIAPDAPDVAQVRAQLHEIESFQ